MWDHRDKEGAGKCRYDLAEQPWLETCQFLGHLICHEGKSHIMGGGGLPLLSPKQQDPHPASNGVPEE